jgi:hypothetical protein
MADSNSTSSFPKAYVNSIRENDPVVIRVDQDKGEIGSRSSGMPKDTLTTGMNIDHVGGKA